MYVCERECVCGAYVCGVCFTGLPICQSASLKPPRRGEQSVALHLSVAFMGRSGGRARQLSEEQAGVRPRPLHSGACERGRVVPSVALHSSVVFVGGRVM